MIDATGSESERFGAKMSAVPTVCAVREEQDDLEAALGHAAQQTPGLLPRLLPRKVVIKPNLCDIAPWETGVTTDPRWVSILAGALRAIRPDVEIQIVESDAVSAYKSWRSCDETFERLGFVAAARAAKVALVNLSQAESLEIRLEGVPYPVRIPELFLEELYFISIANLKVHAYTRMTGVLKNSLGLLCDANISQLHPYLTALICGLHRLFPPDLSVIDGRVGLEGQGPIIGQPVRMNTILFSNDALAADETACRLMGIRVKEVSHLCRLAHILGRRLGGFQVQGELKPRTFEFTEAAAHRAIQRRFRVRAMYHQLDAFTTRWIERAVRFKQRPLKFTTRAIARRLGRRRES